MQRLSKENQNDWNTAIQITKNTDLEKNILLYMKMASQYDIDIPCHITSETLLKCSNMVKKYLQSTPFVVQRPFLEMELLNFEICRGGEEALRVGLRSDGLGQESLARPWRPEQ